LDQENHCGLQWCSCETYWGANSINRHYHPKALAPSKKHIERCRALGLDPGSSVPHKAPIDQASAHSSRTDPAADDRKSLMIESDECVFAWPGPPPSPPAASSSPLHLDAMPEPAYVLSARVWRDMPRQFWPSWRAAVRPVLDRYLTATEAERPSVISLLLNLRLLFYPFVSVGDAGACVN
jgi:hypothetical protein